MTTFANPFNSFANMQTEEDIMEVSNDQERKNAMEEDHFDIDIDLMDGPEENEDEDSMMDDGPSGQDGDQDQQMDDDYEEFGNNQDAEIIDFVDDVPADVEVPMTEESTTQDQDPITSVQNLFNPSHIPDTHAFAPFATQLSPTEAPRNNIEPETFRVGDSLIGKSPSQAPSVPADGVIKSKPSPALHEVSGFGSQQNDFDLNAQNATGTEPATEAVAGNTSETQSTGNGHVDQAKPQVAQTPNDPATAPDPSSLSLVRDQREESADPTSQAREPSPVPDRVESPKPVAGTKSDELENAHNDTTDAVDRTPVSTAQDGAHDDAAYEVSEPPLPVVVTYQGHQMALFPPFGQDEGTPEVYLLPDSSVFDKPINKFLDVCQVHLEESLEQNEGIELEFPSFGFTVRQYDPEAGRHTLRDIAELCFQFQQHDGVDKPQPLKMNMKVTSSLTGHLSYLYDLAAECKGLKYVEELYSSNFDVDNDEFADYAEDENDYSAEGPVQPQIVDTEETRKHATLTSLSGVSAESTQQDQYEEPSMAHVASEEQESPVGTVEVQDEQVKLGPGANTETHEGKISTHRNGGVSRDTFDPAVDAQTAEEIDFGDEEEWNIEENTNPDDSDGDDGQRSTFEHAVEESQSLHSATQPDSKLSALPEPTSERKTQDESDDLANNQPAHSETSSTTLQANDNTVSLATTDADKSKEEEDDIFDDEDDYTGVDNLDDQGDQDEIDFGPDDNEPKSPSLKRIRSEVDEAGDEADADEGTNSAIPLHKRPKLTGAVHPLKRSRSG